MTGKEIREAVDRAIDRAIRQLRADSYEMTLERRRRLVRLVRQQLDELERNLHDNGEGSIAFDFEVFLRSRGKCLPELRVFGRR